MNTKTFVDAVASYFTAHPGEWIDGLTLETVGGRYAWRSRVSDCRTELGMHIENRLRRVERSDGSKVVKSEYRYTPVGITQEPRDKDHADGMGTHSRRGVESSETGRADRLAQPVLPLGVGAVLLPDTSH